MIIILATLGLSSCGTDSHHFKLDGHLLNINSAEFYVYSPDGAINGIDTLKVQAGRFSMEIPCEKEGTLIIVFPNFYEEPVFIEPGKTVDISGDASHLKEIAVDGSKANKSMNAFRDQIKSASPKEVKHDAEQFINDHPESIVSSYLVTKYFIQDPTCDYSKAQKLINKIIQAQPQNGAMKKIIRSMSNLPAASVGHNLPAFNAKDINGKTVASGDISGSLGFIYVWASWDYNAMGYNSILKDFIQKSHGTLKVLGISVDASKTECINYLKRDNQEWSTICTGEMFDTPLLHTLGITTIPSNILIKNGKIIARDLSIDALEKKMNELTGK